MKKEIKWGNIPIKGLKDLSEYDLKSIALKEGGYTNGKKNVENGHCKRIASLGGKAHIKSGHIQSIGKLGGEKTKELYSKPIEAFCKITGKLKLNFTSAKDAARNGFDGKKVRECLKEKRKTHLGYIWKYKK
jgi:hypothetical protein